MTKFNVGDKVRRVNGKHKGMVVGDESVVTGKEHSEGLYLKDFNGIHDPCSLTLVEEKPTPSWHSKAPKEMSPEEAGEFVKDYLNGVTMFWEDGSEAAPRTRSLNGWSLYHKYFSKPPITKEQLEKESIEKELSEMSSKMSDLKSRLEKLNCN